MTSSITLPTMRTHCLGRLLIDLPEDFRLLPGSTVELYYGLDKTFRTIKAEIPRTPPGTAPTLSDLVSRRVAALSAERHFKAASKSLLVSHTPVDEDTHMIVSYRSPDLLGSFKTEVYTKKGNAIGLFSGEAYESESDRPADISANVLSVSRQTASVTTPEQAGPGACLGSLLINARQDGEYYVATYKSERMPDVHFEVRMNSFVAKNDGSLLERWDREAPEAATHGYKYDTIRRGQITLAGRKAEELLDKGQDGGKLFRTFQGETVLLEPATLATPRLDVEMKMGGEYFGVRYDASMSEPEALALWEAIVKSIRFRPGAV